MNMLKDYKALSGYKIDSTNVRNDASLEILSIHFIYELQRKMISKSPEMFWHWNEYAPY